MANRPVFNNHKTLRVFMRQEQVELVKAIVPAIKNRVDACYKVVHGSMKASHPHADGTILICKK